MSFKYKILIVDDDVKGAEILKRALSISFNIQADCIYSAKDAIILSDKINYDAYLIDLNLPDINGIEIISIIKEKRPYVPIIMITGHNEIKTAVNAIKSGAFDYLIKPIEIDHVASVIERAVEQITIKKKSVAKNYENNISELNTIIYSDTSPLNYIIKTIDKISNSDAPVLITGESGVGKELIAKRIHNLSPRSNQPFITVNCGAIPSELIESEFFGHEKGSFTGAIDKRDGLFILADKGTIFLDEIGEMPLPLQVKLLRTLQSGEVRRIGSNTTTYVNVRVLGATSKNLQHEIQSGHFREDLFYRLNVINLNIPSLKDRKSDIPLLIDYFIQNIRIGGKIIKGIDANVLQFFLDYPWPGNIRELKNIIERLMLLSESEIISLKDVENNFKTIKTPNELNNQPNNPPQNCSLKDLELIQINDVLKSVNGNKSKAAKILKVSIQTLYNKLKKHE